MINANELREGNWIISGLWNRQTQFSFFTPTDRDYLSNSQPIPLTPEILEKCGFKKVNNGTQLRIFEGYVFINSLFSRALTLEIDGNRMPLHQIKYLHQLQNLYFALTGEELLIQF